MRQDPICDGALLDRVEAAARATQRREPSEVVLLPRRERMRCAGCGGYGPDGLTVHVTIGSFGAEPLSTRIYDVTLAPKLTAHGAPGRRPSRSENKS